MTRIRFGIDLGGTKIEILALGEGGAEILRRRCATPSMGGAAQYEATIRMIAALVAGAESELGTRGSVGVGIPGIISPATGLVKNANSVALNGQPFDRDLAAALGRAVRIENDANCFALSEAADGAGVGARVVFGVILGTGVGGGIVVDGRLLTGKHQVAGEWGHNPLPWAEAYEHPGPLCWCGRKGCIEALISGPALGRDAGVLDASVLPGLAAAGDVAARAALDRHASRLARSLAQVVNFLDPDVIVLGGGLSNLPHFPGILPDLIKPFVFSDLCAPDVRRAKHGDSSGVRGAAWLWGVDEN
jgi:fructokinase